MKLDVFIALRYLFAKKSHNVINIISAISVAGMAIGTAAFIIILSVYNGFDSLVSSMLGNIEPDFLIRPAEGKVFDPDDEASVYDWLYDQPQVKNVCCVLEENVFINYDGHQRVAKAKGVDAIYEEESPMRKHLREGEFVFHRGDVPLACVGAGLAYEMGMNPRFLTPIEIYFPSRTRSISMANPASSLESVNVWPGSIFSINNEIDNSYLLLPIDRMRELLEYESEVSAVEIRLNEGISARELVKFQKELSARVPEGLELCDRFMQNESLYKMMKYEKLAIWLILFFIIIIIAFNIFGSLTMLIIEKKHDIETLRSMGAGDALIRRIFIYEGWMISLLGLATGLVSGIALTLLQQYTGLIPMPGNFMVSAYPVVLSAWDVLLVAATVAFIGWVVALIPSERVVRSGRGLRGLAVAAALLLCLPSQAQVRFDWNVDASMHFDNRENESSGNEFTPSMTIFGFKLTPEIGLRAISGSAENGYGFRGEAEHRVMLGVDAIVDFGAGRSAKDIAGELEFYYNLNKSMSDKCRMELYAGVFSRNKSHSDYSEAFFSDSLRFYDTNIEGLLLSFLRPKSAYELGVDWMGQIGKGRRERFMIFTAGKSQLMPWLTLGYNAYLYHYANSYEVTGVVDNFLARPYADFDFAPFLPLDRLSLTLGYYQAYQRDRLNSGVPLLPQGGELLFEVRKWNVSLRNSLYYGKDLMPLYNALDGGGFKYGNDLYYGDPYYRIRGGIEAGDRAAIFDRLDIFWEPRIAPGLYMKIAARFNFNGKYSGCSQMVSLRFSLDELRANKRK